MTRREMLGTVGKAAAVAVVLPPVLHGCLEAGAPTASAPDGLGALAGPGAVEFADANARVTTATFSAPGTYVLKLTADNGQLEVESSFEVLVENGPPLDHLDPVTTKEYTVSNRLWNQKVRALIVSWIPHCIDMINRDDLKPGPGGIDNFIEADRGRVALKYGPLVYNIEQGDQDIDQALGRRSPPTAEWREDFLGGVTVIRGSFANGTPLLAIPNFARYDGAAGTSAPMRPDPPPDGSRPEPFPASSIVWIWEA